MGFFDAVRDANQAKKVAAGGDLSALLVEGEQIEQQISLVADVFTFTNKRVIFVDGRVFSSRRAVVSIPYSKITEIAMFSGGGMTISQEIVIQVGSIQHEVKTYDPKQAVELYRALSAKMM